MPSINLDEEARQAQSIGLVALTIELSTGTDYYYTSDLL